MVVPADGPGPRRAVTVDHDAAEIITGPEVITRGWIYADEAEELLEEMRNLIADADGV